MTGRRCEPTATRGLSRVRQRPVGRLHHVRPRRVPRAAERWQPGHLLGQRVSAVGDGRHTAFPVGAARSANLFPNGQCTWYAEQEAFNYAGRYINIWGDAHAWAGSASSSGWAVGTYPRIGSVIVFAAGSDGAGYYGHVAWVTRVYPAAHAVALSEMNYLGPGIVDSRAVTTGSAIRPSLHLPDPVDGSARGQGRLGWATVSRRVPAPDARRPSVMALATRLAAVAFVEHAPAPFSTVKPRSVNGPDAMRGTCTWLLAVPRPDDDGGDLVEALVRPRARIREKLERTPSPSGRHFKYRQARWFAGEGRAAGRALGDTPRPRRDAPVACRDSPTSRRA